MKFVSNKEDISFFESNFINDIVSEIEKKYCSNKKDFRSFCPCCSHESYSYAFEKKGFHYVECTKCNTLYVQNILPAETLKEIRQEIENKINENESTVRIISKSSENILYNFNLFLNRTFEITSKKINIGYIGNKKNLFLKELIKYENVILEDFKATSSYDLVIINNFLEKDVSPIQMINEIKASLNKGAYIYITTRISDGIDILTLWEESNISPVEHINLLSIEGIKNYLLEDFIIKDLSTPGTMDIDFIVNSKSKNLPKFMNYIKNRGDQKILDEFQNFLQKNLLSSYLLIVGQIK